MSLTYRLRQRVAIQEMIEGQDATTGEVTISWQNVWIDSESELDAVPAEVLTGAGREVVAAGAIQAETSARINLRWFPGLTAAMRILWDGKVYNIRSIETDRTGRMEYRTTCTDGVNAG